MPNPKKLRKSKGYARKPPRKLVAAIERAMSLFYDQDDYEAAWQILSELVGRYPNNRVVLEAVVEISIEVEDWYSLARYGELLRPLVGAEDQATILNNLLVSYGKLNYPSLARRTAEQLLAKHGDRVEAADLGSFIEGVEGFLLEHADEYLGLVDLSTEEKLELLLKHDQVRFYMESGENEKGVALAYSLLEQLPTFVPALNNLSQMLFTVGEEEQAIVRAKQVLEQEPENVHALGNLSRFYFLTGDFVAAEKVASTLKQLQSDHSDLQAKQMEVLAYLGDDEGVRAAYRQAKKRNRQLFPLMLHLAAVAHYRLGDEKTAWRLWREAAQQGPGSWLVAECLQEKQLPYGQRTIPWYWPLTYWFPGDFRQTVGKHLEKLSRNLSEEQTKSAGRALLEEYPYLPSLFPHILEKGDETARRTVFDLIRFAGLSESFATLYVFGMGRYGSDGLRMEVMQYLKAEAPEMVPEGGNVVMWSNGKPSEVVLLEFDIYFEVEEAVDVAEAILDKHEKAHDLLLDERPDEAEVLLEEVVAEAPDFPAGYNQLAVAYEMQGRREEALALIEETHRRFPDYDFARINLAHILATRSRVDEARELLKPVITRNKLHISEFRALAGAQMEIALAQGNRDAARSWLTMWQNIEDDHPALLDWQMRLEGDGAFMRLMREMLREKDEH